MSKNYILNSSENFEIDITAYEIDDLSESNCIIFLHGFKGFKDWGFVPYLGDYLSNKGFFVIKLKFFRCKKFFYFFIIIFTFNQLGHNLKNGKEFY